MLWTLKAAVAESTPWHAHEVYELILSFRSGGRLALGSRELDFRQRRAVLIAPDVRHRYVLRAGEVADLHVACLTPSDLATFLPPAISEALQALRDVGVAYADLGSAPSGIWEASRLIPDVPVAHDPLRARLGWAAIGVLLNWICRDLFSSTPAEADRRRVRFEPIRAWVDSHLDSDIRLDDLAERFGVSRSSISREFRRHTGWSVVEYCNARRIERSAQRLVDGGDRVAEIAKACGFDNLSHFHRQFKAYYGLTPGSFRRMAVGAGMTQIGGIPQQA